jgi:hypothetical protein
LLFTLFVETEGEVGVAAGLPPNWYIAFPTLLKPLLRIPISAAFPPLLFVNFPVNDPGVCPPTPWEAVVACGGVILALKDPEEDCLAGVPAIPPPNDPNANFEPGTAPAEDPVLLPASF